jgi:hypothetical protein
MFPAYLTRNRQLVKHYAVLHLIRHLLETQSATRATECLSLGDYGMTFMLASISKGVKATHPLRCMEGPVLWCMYLPLNSPFTFLYTNPGENWRKLTLAMFTSTCTTLTNNILPSSVKLSRHKKPAMPLSSLPFAVAVKQKNKHSSCSQHPTGTFDQSYHDVSLPFH